MHVRVLVVATALVAVVAGGLAVAAVVAWPHVRLDASDDALARIELRGFAGHVTSVAAGSTAGAQVPVELRGGEVWPVRKLAVGERLTVDVTVRRPGWAAWLVGKTERRSFTIATPSAHLLGRLLQVKDGRPVSVAFDQPVSVVSFAGGRARPLAAPAAVVPVPVTASGGRVAGSIEVAAAARTWESLPAPVRASWFPARPYPQLLAEPKPTGRLAPDGELTLSFSAPVHDVLGTRLPQLDPVTPGHWRLLDAHTLAFRPTGLGFGLGRDVRVDLPRAVHLAGERGANVTRVLQWHVPDGSTLRLQQLLAQLGYLPLRWQPAADPPASSVHAQLADALSPPPGVFVWNYLDTPSELRALWRPGEPNDIVRGAVMFFEHTHQLAVDGLVGPRVWRALIGDAIAGKRRSGGYSYVFVHRNLPQSLNLWHDGKVILTSPGNTGVPAAPTQLGTFPVFEHIPVGTMSGTNPDGSHYHDPGIRWISYFHHGEAIHSFNRSSFGTPQSLGCVELPLDAAAKVWPYTPIGTLVTIEN
jgi:hypothetical protein